MVPTFQLLLDCETVTFFLLFSFFYFVFVSFYRIFRRIFRFSSQSHSPLPSPPFPPAPHLLQTIRSTIPRSWLTQKVRAVLWSELQIKGGKFLSTTFGKRTSSFPQKKKGTTTTTTIKIGKQNRV